MKWGEAEIWLQQQLSAIENNGEAAAIANLVMERITGGDRAKRKSNKHEKLTVQQLHHLTEVNQRLQKREPVQYILQEAWFYGLRFFVNNSVLIPRPETEELVDWIIKDVKAAGIPVFEKAATDADLTRTLKILDVCSGSGCIALSLKKHLPLAEVWGCDISDAALNVSRRNASELDVRVDFQGTDILDPEQQKGLPSVDIIVCNPPYIPVSGSPDLEANIVDHEPHEAIFVPDEDPFMFYRAIAAFGKDRLHSAGSIYCEMHDGKGRELKSLFEEQGYKNVEVRNDMQGKERMIRAYKA